MRRNKLNFVIDLVSLLVMWGLLTTGLLIRYVLPAGSGHWLALGGWNRHDWGDVHFWLAAGGCLLMSVHVWLHWQWVCATARRFMTTRDANGQTRSRTWRNTWGVATILLLVGLTAGLLVAADGSVTKLDRPDADHDGRGHPTVGRDAHQHEAGDRAIRGSSTLAEVAVVKKMPVAKLRQRLGIPADVPADETIGRLRRQYSFSVQQVREIPASGASFGSKADGGR